MNVPALPEEKIKGIKVTRQGKVNWKDTFDMRRDPNNHIYYWLTGTLEVLDHSKDTDQIAVMNKYVSITPIHYDLTDYPMIDVLKSWDFHKM